VALLPLLSRTVVIDSFVARGATAHLVRTKEGIQLPRLLPARTKTPAAGEPSPPRGGESAAFDIVLGGFELCGGALLVEDRSLSPPVIWEARDVCLRVRGTSPDELLAFEFTLGLASGGRLAASGTTTLTGEVDVELTLDAVDVAPARAYLGPGSELTGALSGTVVARRPAAGTASVRIDVALDEGGFQLGGMLLRGHVDIEADVAGGLASPRGAFEIDATGAAILYGGGFEKPPGDAATVTGHIATASDGRPGLEEVRLKIRNFRVDARAPTEERLPVVADGRREVRQLGFAAHDLRVPEDAAKGRSTLQPVGAGLVVISLQVSAPGRSIYGSGYSRGTEWPAPFSVSTTTAISVRSSRRPWPRRATAS
jgi:hypothetical protein